jgi:transposase-like protein
MASRMFSSEQRAKLTQLVNEGIQVMQEVEDLNAGLSDTIKAVAEELEIKPAILKKAIKIAQKSKFTDTNADHEELTDILETVGRTL